MTTNPTPTDWFQHFYRPNLTSPPPPSSGSRVSDSTVVSTTISTNSIPPQETTTTTTTNDNNSYISLSELGLAVSVPGPVSASTSRLLSPPRVGRVSKPARRRQRASKKTPTTLLNTDTAHFRSMVQRYTGGPSAYDPQPGQIGNFIQHGTSSFRLGLGMHLPDLSSSASSVDHVQPHNVHHQILQQYGGGVNDGGASSSTAVNRRATGTTMEEEIGFYSVNHHLGPAGGNSDHSSSLAGDENKRSGFMF